MRRFFPAILSLAVPGAVMAEGPVENLHGYTIADPYRFLETDEGAADWIEGQREKARAFFAGQEEGREAIARRQDELSRIGGVSGPRVRGEKTFYTKRTGVQEQGILYVLEDGEERALLDPASLDAEGKVAMDWFHPSPSGKLVAYGLSRDGSERSTLHLLEVATGQVRAETIPNTRAASVAWLPDESGFYYTRYPEGENYNRWVYFHELGSDPAADRHVFGEGSIEKTDWPSIKLAEDGKTLFILVSKGWSATEFWILGHKEKEARRLVDGELGALFGDPAMVKGRILLVTNHEAPNFRVISMDPKKPAPKNWQTVIPEGDWPLDGMNVVGGKLVVERLVKAVSYVELFDLDGKKEGTIELPGIGSVFAASGEAEQSRLVVGFTSFLVPPTLYETNVSQGPAPLKLLAQVPAPSLDGVVVEQVDFPSYDGTWVPMFLMRRADAPKDRSNFTLLTGYGGFNVSVTPGFSTTALAWVEKGGVYAVANLRGGAEKGKAWHEAGRLEHKHQVYRDFEYAMRHLIREGWTHPDRLAITGGSNGGLLMGAMMTQAPELFRVAVGRVGLYDMIRFQRFLIAELWVAEYGSSENKDQIGYLLGYSPYHQVLPGVKYPAFLGMTARADSRVSWVHTAKFVAALQAAHGGEAPILFHMEERAGHGQGKGRSDRAQEEAMMIQFILSQLVPASPKLENPKRAERN